MHNFPYHRNCWKGEVFLNASPKERLILAWVNGPRMVVWVPFSGTLTGAWVWIEIETKKSCASINYTNPNSDSDFEYWELRVRTPRNGGYEANSGSSDRAYNPMHPLILQILIQTMSGENWELTVRTSRNGGYEANSGSSERAYNAVHPLILQILIQTLSGEYWELWVRIHLSLLQFKFQSTLWIIFFQLFEIHILNFQTYFVPRFTHKFYGIKVFFYYFFSLHCIQFLLVNECQLFYNQVSYLRHYNPWFFLRLRYV